MPCVLLMDDTLTASGAMIGGCQSGLEKLGVRCVHEGGRTSSGQPLTDVRLLGERLLNRLREEQADAFVLDIHWGDHVKFDGFDIWKSARESGMRYDLKQCVFMTMHIPLEKARKKAEGLGFDPRQIVIKNEQGKSAAIKWLCDVLDIVG